jgi:hypothetical protein
MSRSLQAPSNTPWYSFVYEFRSAAEAPVELIEILEQDRGWTHAVFFPRMEATSRQPLSPPAVCVFRESALRIYRIWDEREVTCQEAALSGIDRIVVQLYLTKCSLALSWPGGGARLRFPVHGAEQVLALCERLAGPGWTRTARPEPVLGYGMEIELRRS